MHAIVLTAALAATGGWGAPRSCPNGSCPTPTYYAMAPGASPTTYAVPAQVAPAPAPVYYYYPATVAQPSAYRYVTMSSCPGGTCPRR